MAQKKLVTVNEAMEALKAGKKVYRQAWHATKLVKYIPESDTDFEGALADWYGKQASWNPVAADIMNDDWIIED